MKRIHDKACLHSEANQDGDEILLSFFAIWSTCNVTVGSQLDELYGIEVAIRKVVRYLGPAK